MRFLYGCNNGAIMAEYDMGFIKAIYKDVNGFTLWSFIS